jgi:hypothetical protein
LESTYLRVGNAGKGLKGDRIQGETLERRRRKATQERPHVREGMGTNN